MNLALFHPKLNKMSFIILDESNSMLQVAPRYFFTPYGVFFCLGRSHFTSVAVMFRCCILLPEVQNLCRLVCCLITQESFNRVHQ